MTKDDELVKQIKSDYRRAKLDAKTRALLDFAVAIATDVHQIDRNYVDRLRTTGATDREILDTTEIAGFFCYYTRLVDALGIEPEDFMKK